MRLWFLAAALFLSLQSGVMAQCANGLGFGTGYPANCEPAAGPPNLGDVVGGQQASNGQNLKWNFGQIFTNTPLTNPTITGGSAAFSGALSAPSFVITPGTPGSPVNGQIYVTASGAFAQTAAGLINLGGQGATSGHFFSYLDGSNTWSNPNTFLNGNLGVQGSGGGISTWVSDNLTASAFQWHTPGANAAPLWYPPGSPPGTGLCAVTTGVLGQVSFQTCGGSGGLGTVKDSFADTFTGVTSLQIGGTTCALDSGTVVCNPTTPPRVVTGSTAITAADMGNAIVFPSNTTNNAGSVVLTVPVSGAGLWGSGQGLWVSNESTQPITITVATGTGAVTIEPTNPTILPAAINGIPSWVLLTSDGTNLHPLWGGNAPNAAFTNQYQAWLATQATTTQTPTPSGGTFTPVLAANNNILVNLTTGCTCTLANFTGSIANDVDGVIKVKQPTSGSAGTLGFGSQYVAGGGTTTITLATALGSYTYIGFHADATTGNVVLFPPVQAPTH